MAAPELCSPEQVFASLYSRQECSVTVRIADVNPAVCSPSSYVYPPYLINFVMMTEVPRWSVTSSNSDVVIKILKTSTEVATVFFLLGL